MKNKLASTLLYFCFLFCIATNLHAADLDSGGTHIGRERSSSNDASSGAENRAITSVIKTRYFDIIYKKSSAETASLLAEYADGYADEICTLLDTSMKGRLPVYLDPDVDVLDAAFTAYPYNRIYLYDTIPSDGEIAVFRNSILRVFYHELTHAVSINIRSPFWQFMSGIFSDSLSVNMLATMPLSFIEGVTVSFESRDGEGRLNDPLTMEYLAQDKIEGKFLDWKQAAGSFDLYPEARSSYLYGGAFSAWLQKTYGMERYAELWKRGGSFNPFRSTIGSRFKQVYGRSLTAAWTEFRDAFPVPENIGVNRDRLGGTVDGIYSALASGPEGVAWHDENAGGVFFRNNDGKIRKLFDSDSTLTRLSFSPDGALLLASDSLLSENVVKCRVRIFDMKRKKFLDESYTDLRDASFAETSSTICGIESHSQRSSLVLFTRGAWTARRILMEAGPGMPFSLLFNPVSAGNGSLACIGANGSARELLLIDGATGKPVVANLPEQVGYIRYLQSAQSNGKSILTFSWTEKNALYRYGVYRPADGSLVLQNTDYSGGVFCPVFDPVTGGICYVAFFSGHDEIMTLSEKESVAYSIDTGSSKPLPVPVSFPVPSEAKASRPFNPLPWFSKGTFIPWFQNLPIHTGLGSKAPGFFYITTDPSETVTVMASPFFSVNPFYADWSLDLLASLRSFTVQSSSQDHLESRVSGFGTYRDVHTALTLERSFTPEASWKYLLCSVTGTAHAYASDVELHENPYWAPFTASSLAGDTAIVYSAICRNQLSGTPFFRVSKTGFSAGIYGYYGMLLPDRSATPAIQSRITAFIPRVPFSFKLSSAWSDGLLFSPAKVYTETKCARDFASGIVRQVPEFPEYKGTKYEDKASSRVWGVVAEVTPLTVEIQKGIIFFPAYANRFTEVVGYRGAFFDTGNSERCYVDSVYARSTLQGTIVSGILYRILLSANVEYVRPLRAGVPHIFISFGTNIEL